MREAVIAVGDSELAALGIGELVSLCRDAGLRSFEEFACYGDGAVVLVEVETRLDERRLDELDYVGRWESVGGSDDAHRYVVAFTAPGLSERIAGHVDDLLGTCDPQVGDSEAELSFLGPKEAIRGVIDEYERAGLSPELRRLGGYDGDERPTDALTERQRKVVQTAYDEGYYDVPRRSSADEVAAELDLDPSTVSEHLQRAERNLLSRILGDGG